MVTESSPEILLTVVKKLLIAVVDFSLETFDLGSGKMSAYSLNATLECSRRLIIASLFDNTKFLQCLQLVY